MAIPNKATLNELYIKKKMSMPKIGKKFHVHYITIRNWLIKYNIPRRKKGERTDCWTKEEIQILKYNRGKSMEELLKLLPARTNQAIYEKLEKLGYMRCLEKFNYRARETIDLKIEEWSYLAGIIDGEGMVTIEKQKKRNSSHPKIAITTTDKNLSNWLQKKVNTTCVVSHSKYSNYKTKHECFIHGYSCKPILEKVLPFLKIKDKHAKLVLKFINLRLSRKDVRGHNKKEKEIYNKIRKLYNK